MNVRNITSCPTKLDVFRNRGRNLGCSVGNEYHCMLDEKKHHVELCISRSWIQPDHCPEYNTAANRIDVTSCEASDGVCPPTIYWSNTSFQYNGCLRNSATVITNDPEEESSDVLVPVVISVVIVLLLVILSVVLLCCVKRRLRNKRDKKKTLLELPQLPLVSPEQMEKGRQIIEEHQNDGTYVPTIAANKGKEILNKKNILIIKGITGSGKTKTALHIASEWMKKNEKIRQCVYLNSIEDHRMLNVKDNTCIVLDDCFTRWVLDSSSPFLPELCLLLHTQVKKHKNMYLIITVNEKIFFSRRQMLQKYPLFSKDHVVILDYPDFEEKKKILISRATKSSDEETYHLSCATEPHIDKSPRPKLTEKKLNELLSAYSRTEPIIGLPSVCWMYINIPECTKEGDTFFRACSFKIAKILTSMKNPLKCCLHYAMLQRKCCFVDTNSLDQKCLKELRDIFGYKEMTENSIQDCFKKERNYFSVGQNPGIYKFSQNVLYEQCLKEWIGEERRHRFLLLCNIEQVKENIRDENYKVGSADVILRLKNSEYAEFAPKFASLWKVHEELKHHPLLQNEIFRKHVDEECAKQQMKEDLTHENETGEIPNQSLSDGEKKSKGSEDTCARKSKQPMQASPQLTLDEKEQEDSPLLNEMSV